LGPSRGFYARCAGFAGGGCLPLKVGLWGPLTTGLLSQDCAVRLLAPPFHFLLNKLNSQLSWEAGWDTERLRWDGHSGSKDCGMPTGFRRVLQKPGALPAQFAAPSLRFMANFGLLEAIPLPGLSQLPQTCLACLSPGSACPTVLGGGVLATCIPTKRCQTGRVHGGHGTDSQLCHAGRFVETGIGGMIQLLTLKAPSIPSPGTLALRGGPWPCSAAPTFCQGLPLLSRYSPDPPHIRQSGNCKWIGHRHIRGVHEFAARHKEHRSHAYPSSR
jgi:hypothetical protein